MSDPATNDAFLRLTQHTSELSAGSWPTLDPLALYGLAGDVVDALEPHTEADPAGLLVSLISYFVNAAGLSPYFMVGGAQHRARLNAVLVGESSRSRKGQTHAEVRRLMWHADQGWTDHRELGGLGSGEALIAAVADPPADENGDVPKVDKRLLVVEPEFARILAVAGREGSTLSAIVRDAWDRDRLRVATRRDPITATGVHIAVVGHITLEELRRRLTDTDVLNGFCNRFLHVLVRRSKLLSSGGSLDDHSIEVLGRRLKDALEAARRVGRMQRTPSAEQRWDEIYREIAADEPAGMVGAATARAEAQTLRLSMAYALMDGSPMIDTAHLEAAWATWRYCDDSAHLIYGDAIGDEIADRLLTAIRDAGPEGLTKTEQSNLFGRNVNKARLDVARGTLVDGGLAEWVRIGDATVLLATPDEKHENDENGGLNREAIR